MKVIAISTTLVGVVFIVLSLIIRAIVYKTTKQSLEEVEPNNYLDHTEEDDFEGVNNRSKEADSEKENVEKPKDESHSAVDSEQTHTDNSDLKDSASYTEDRHSSVVSDAKDEINEAEEQTTEDSTKKNNKTYKKNLRHFVTLKFFLYITLYS